MSMRPGGSKEQQATQAEAIYMHKLQPSNPLSSIPSIPFLSAMP